jgi:membrane protease subunit HflK
VKGTVYILIGLLLAGYLATGVYQVRPGELAVVRRFGRVLEEPRLPGLNVGLPWGLDRVDRVAVDEQRQLTIGFQESEDQRRGSVPAGQLLTGDNHLIDVRATIYYRVNRESVVSFVLHEGLAESVMTRAAEEALAATLAGERMDAVLLGQARDLELRTQEQLAQRLRYLHMGVAVESVNLTYAQPPAELAEVFREVNRARTQKENARTEAERWRETEISLARNQARQHRAEAQAAGRARVTRAAAEADSFRALVRATPNSASDPNGNLLTLYLKEMQTIFSRFKVRTLSDPTVDHTIVLPGGDR